MSKNGDTTYARRVDFGSFAAETLGFVEAARQDLVEKAAEAGRPLRLAAVPHLVQFFDAPCCAAQETQEVRGAVVLSFLFFSPFVTFALKVLFRDQLKRLTENVFLPTRKVSGACPPSHSRPGLPAVGAETDAERNAPALGRCCSRA